MEIFSLALLNLKDGMQQEGCPLCRCFLRVETGFLKSLLWENINDVGTRVRLTESLGACGRHAQQMLQMELDGWDVPLGNGILYEGLTHDVSLRLQKAEALAEKQARRGWLDRLRDRLRKREHRAEGLDRLLTPGKGCRVCEIGQQSVHFHAETLLEMLAYPEYQPLYERSEGVCLPHLRLMLEVGQPEAGLRYLLAESQQRIKALETDLREYTRKQSYQFHHEPVSEGERTAVARALAFFGGLDAATSVGIEQRYKKEVSAGDRAVITDW